MELENSGRISLQGETDEDGNIATSAFTTQNYEPSGQWLIIVDDTQIGATNEINNFAISGINEWSVFSMFFTATATQHTFDFGANWLSGGSHVGMGIDNIQLTTVPIPSAIWLLGSALLGLFGTSKERPGK